MLLRRFLFFFVMVGAACAENLIYKDDLLPILVQRVSSLLKTYDPETGRFGTGIWNCRDQQIMYPLAAVYDASDADNAYWKDPGLLARIIRAGDALIDDMDGEGQWEFRKKDGSTWGMIRMPWTYSRWIWTFAAIRDDMPEIDRRRWETALSIGYENILEKDLGHVHNITSHHAMGLYFAGEALGKPEWKQAASDFLAKVLDDQSEGGYWSENVGPVVNYNFVYLDALGAYYSLSRDERALPALEKGARYHYWFTYPDGTDVETIDERNPYHERVQPGNVGFTFTPIGRSYLARQWKILGLNALSSDLIASLLLYGEEGSGESPAAARGASPFLLKEARETRAAILRDGPWFICLSAFTAPIPASRWIQDRQNLISIYHDDVGLILGGGNTKLQPLWSTFVVGDSDLLRHQPGDSDPGFEPIGELYHIPSHARIVHGTNIGLDLQYGPEEARIRIEILDAETLSIQLAMTRRSDLPVAAHLTLLPHFDESISTDNNLVIDLKKSTVHAPGGFFETRLSHAGYTIDVPVGARLHWPVLPHNPYRKDGSATREEGRVVVRIPFDLGIVDQKVRLTIDRRPPD